MGDFGSLLGTVGTGIQTGANSLWSGLQGAGKGFADSGLDKLFGTGIGLWQAKESSDLNKQLMGQRDMELGMNVQAFNRDKAYQDALKGIDWTSGQ